MTEKVTLDVWAQRANLKHNHLYTYLEVLNLPGRDAKLRAVCRVHGEFVIGANQHCGDKKPGHCPACAAEHRTKTKIKSLDTWVAEWRLKHGDKFQYTSLTERAGETWVQFTCPEHGAREQRAGQHKVYGCSACGHAVRGLSRRNTFEDLVIQANQIHGGKFGYLSLEHAEPSPVLTAVCRDHGQFRISVLSHVNAGNGCSMCGDLSTGLQNRKSDEHWLARAKEVHGDTYEYIAQEYLNSRKFFHIRCSVHGGFFQDASSHIDGCGCPRCGSGSYGNKTTRAMAEHLVALGMTVQEELRLNSTTRSRWDLSVEDASLAIELDGVYWHSEQYRTNSNMLDKANLVAAAGYRQINIWDDEWRNKQSVVERMLANAVGKSKDRKVAARKTTVAAVDHKAAQAFLEAHHIQGGVTASEHWGLHDGTELVALMSVTQKASGRDNSHNPEQMELQRYCTSANVQGGFQKLLKHAANRQGLKRITTFSDPRHFTGEVYKRAGFTLAHTYGPDYQYVKGGTRFSKRSRQKSWFLEESQRDGSSVLFDPDMTEHELANLNGYYRLYDRGRVRWELHL